MDPRKLKILEDLISHLGGKENSHFKSALDLERAPKLPIEGSDEEEKLESPHDEMLEDGKPKGISIEKLSIMAKPKGPMDGLMGKKPGGVGVEDPAEEASEPAEDEMSDDELKELLEKYMTQKA